jgi:hypothetical protein
MSYSLDDFCEDTRTILHGADNHAARDRIRKKLELLLVDPDFRAAHLGADAKGMKQIYEDPELKFCVLAYNMDAPRTSPPHDHGESWAVYGQAAGHTDMTVWSVGDTDDDKADLVPTRTFRLNPGQAGLFDVGDVHSIDYTAGSKFVRVTGVDLSHTTRRVFNPETGEVKVVEQVGTGNAR